MSNDDRFSADDHYSARPAKKSSGAGWIFGVSGCVLFAVMAPFLLVCGCCGGLMQWAMNEEANQIAAAVQSDETFQAEIGEVSSCTINWSESMGAGDDVFVYDVSGDKGSGQLHVYEEGDVPERIVLHKGDQQWDLDFDPDDLRDLSLDPELVKAIEGDPAIQTEIGGIIQCDMNLSASIQEEEANVFVYDIVGEKGSGQITVEFDDDDKIMWAMLTKEGRVIDLKISPSQSSPQAKEMASEPGTE
ncbi:hypothetical protein M4951_20575 [Blastopirellula sp. J2-11]|uniref:hypothetical protein n=1 Tax=Blastopirellula sp. J2-11 TaxID=2943192 RepID=UPI0021C5C132|nr:hypothetical protein [Blastopirellula sp. J2-11]UUO05757.1 hypothetical protein M4951_20575 [Blastopirellula sp. J2-11]